MEYKINVGTILKAKKKGFLKGSFKVMYCGMSNEITFVLAPFTNVGYAGFSPNIYYSLESHLIQVMDMEFEIISVTPDYIIVRY